jgi:spore maturation protein CgeB
MSRVLFIGDLNEYGRSFRRLRTLLEMGHEVIAYSHTYVSQPEIIDPPSILHRIFWKLRFPLDEMGVNKILKSEIKKSAFDVIWIEKGNMVKPWILKILKKSAPNIPLISCSEDDMFAKHSHSIWYSQGLKYYDCVFTTKIYNLQELKVMGAKKVKLFLDSYDEKLHMPMNLSNDELQLLGSDVSAIGAFEIERANSLLYLAEHGIKVTIWGNGWSKWVGRHRNLDIRNKFLFGVDYPKAISGSKINLNFLRKINRDEITSRSIEIPACGGFMLAERTQRHLDFFIEGKEAEFFSSNEELLLKIKKYSDNNLVREKIGFAGRDRCQKSGYSMRSQLKLILDEVLV